MVSAVFDCLSDALPPFTSTLYARPRSSSSTDLHPPITTCKSSLPLPHATYADGYVSCLFGVPMALLERRWRHDCCAALAFAFLTYAAVRLEMTGETLTCLPSGEVGEHYYISMTRARGLCTMAPGVRPPSTVPLASAFIPRHPLVQQSHSLSTVCSPVLLYFRSFVEGVVCVVANDVAGI